MQYNRIISRKNIYLFPKEQTRAPLFWQIYGHCGQKTVFVVKNIYLCSPIRQKIK